MSYYLLEKIMYELVEMVGVHVQWTPPFGWQNFGWNWLKNTVLTELLWEKNTIPAEKKAEQTEYGVSLRKPEGMH